MIIKVIGSAEDKPISIKIKDLQYVDGIITDYPQLTNKPQINGHELDGDQSASELDLGTYSAPDGGIPKADLSSDVARTLDEANAVSQSLDYNATESDVGKALVAQTVADGKVTKYTLGEITRPYFIETSVSAIYYDLSAPGGQRISPSTITINAYRADFDGSIREETVNFIRVDFCRADGTISRSDGFSNTSTATVNVLQNLVPNGYMKIRLQSAQTNYKIYQTRVIPVVSMPATSKIDKPANPETGAFLVWNGTAWVAQTVEMWQEGGNY